MLKPGSLWSVKTDDGFTRQTVEVVSFDNYNVAYFYQSGRSHILPLDLFLYLYSPAGEDAKWIPLETLQPRRNWFYKTALRVQRFFSRTSPTR